jgi:hypothetical protein
MEYLCQMLDMFFQGPTIYEYVIHEDQYEFSHECDKDRVHQTLECSWCIGQAKWHDPKLEMPMMCFKS